VSEICKRKGEALPKTETPEDVFTFKTSADLESTFEELDIDIDYVETSQIRDRSVKEISEDQAITAYLKQSARKIRNNPDSIAQTIHSIIPYHHQEQTAVVIYTFNPIPELHKKDWSEEFLGFPVFVINLMYIYEVPPPVLPECYPVIPLDDQIRYSTIKDKVTQEIAKEHSNLSTISVDFRIKNNKLDEDEVCLQIGVLTKGIIPLGEEMISKEIGGVPVDVVECCATLCIQLPMRRYVWPVNPGAGIGVEDDNTSTGSLGCVVKHNETGEDYFLTCAHVVRRKGRAVLSIVQPSQQDYDEMQSNLDKIIEVNKTTCDTLKARISDGGDVQMKNELEKEEKLCRREEELLEKNLENQRPRKIGTFSSKDEHFVRENNYSCKASSKSYGLDAAIALIESDEFEPEDMNKVNNWPDNLRDEDGKIVKEITLNGNFKNEKEVQEALDSQTIVYKCGRTTGVTKGTLFKEINVKLGGAGSTFMPTSHESDGDAESKAERSRTKQNEDVWYNVLHIKSPTDKKTGKRSFSVDGDSGAVVFDVNGSCVGLLFGRLNSQVFPFGGGLATPIHAVFDALEITLATPSDFYKSR
jgi:hypothetical protein